MKTCAKWVCLARTVEMKRQTMTTTITMATGNVSEWGRQRSHKMTREREKKNVTTTKPFHLVSYANSSSSIQRSELVNIHQCISGLVHDVCFWNYLTNLMRSHHTFVHYILAVVFVAAYKLMTTLYLIRENLLIVTVLSIVIPVILISRTPFHSIPPLTISLDLIFNWLYRFARPLSHSVSHPFLI